MTGYGRGEASAQGRKFTVELKAVNHRFNEVVLRLPRSLSSLEDRLRRKILSRLARGRIDCFLGMECCEGRTDAVKVDKALAEAYYKAMKELQESLGIEGKVKVKHLAALPGVLVIEETAEDVEKWWPAVQEAMDNALENLIQMRAEEGRQLAGDILKRVQHVALLNERIKGRAPAVVEEHRERLKARLNDFFKNGILDADRLAAEAALFAERSNINEETVRLESHVRQMLACLGADEPVGRKMEFLIQEMNREINTIASKANDLEISRWVVEVKSELEKIREQVQNIE